MVQFGEDHQVTFHVKVLSGDQFGRSGEFFLRGFPDKLLDLAHTLSADHFKLCGVQKYLDIAVRCISDNVDMRRPLTPRAGLL